MPKVSSDGVEVRGAGGQEAQLGADGLDGASDRRWLVRLQVVHDDDVAGGQSRHQNLFDWTRCQGLSSAIRRAGAKSLTQHLDPVTGAAKDLVQHHAQLV